MVMAIAWNKLSHHQSLHNLRDAYKPRSANRQRTPLNARSYNLGRPRRGSPIALEPKLTAVQAQLVELALVFRDVFRKQLTIHSMRNTENIDLNARRHEFLGVIQNAHANARNGLACWGLNREV